ncbi:hypothetical protein QAD02_006510 [Eretmocerus hayati]|uniref:Uncharacterized protein n=1 Tax=Eretmocerus hayati TaxID=131215 RepID=A0ACC2N279_9HYME|nr:hypothetical protein QAD02_006510 [Eretmocerus hayati]
MYLGIQYPIDISGEVLLPEVNGSYQVSGFDSKSNKDFVCDISYSYVNTVMKFKLILDPFFSLKSKIELKVLDDQIKEAKLSMDGCSIDQMKTELKNDFEQRVRNAKIKIVEAIAAKMTKEIEPRVTDILPRLARQVASEIIENFGVKLDPYFTDNDQEFLIDIHVTKNDG